MCLLALRFDVLGTYMEFLPDTGLRLYLVSKLTYGFRISLDKIFPIFEIQLGPLNIWFLEIF